MASEELKPCPFCGGTNVEPCHDDGIFWHKCKACGATGPTLSRYSGEEGEPYTEWNTSAQDFDAMRQRAEKAELAAMRGAQLLAEVTSSDGSGHADLAALILSDAGVSRDEAAKLIKGWKAKSQWRIDAALAKQVKP